MAKSDSRDERGFGNDRSSDGSGFGGSFGGNGSSGGKGRSGQDDSWQDVNPDDFESEQLLALDIELVGAHVPTWRRVIVPAIYPVDELHFIIMLLFDWTGTGSYCFQRGPIVYEYPDSPAVQVPSVRRSGNRHLDSTRYTMLDLFPEQDASADYFYDVGDIWRLTIQRVGDMVGSEYPFSMIPVCYEGEGNNPPEDVGGVEGYKDLCKDLGDANSPDHQSARMYMELEEGQEFNPAFFDLEDANYLLAHDQVDAMEDELLPKDPAKLRDLTKDLLAEEAANEANDIIRMSRIAEKLNTPAGHQFLESVFQDMLANQSQYPEGHAPEGEPYWVGHSPATSGYWQEQTSGQSSSGFHVVRPETAGAAAKGGAAGGAGAAGGKDATGGAKGAGKAAGAGAGPGATAGAAAGAVAGAGKSAGAGAAVGAAKGGAAKKGKAAAQKPDREPQPNPYLDLFREELSRSGISQKTVDKHLANVEYFLNVYLPEEGLSVREGCYRIDDYMGFYLPHKCPWTTLTAAKENVTSLKKFYKCMLGKGVVDPVDYAFVEDTITEFKDEWLQEY